MSRQGTRSIAETSDLTGLSAHTLRYYERIGLLDAVERGPAGRRRFRDADLDWLRFLKRLRTTAMPIRDRLEFSRLRRLGDTTVPARLELLGRHRESVRSRIAELSECLRALDEKIDHYEKLAGSRASGSADHAAASSDTQYG